MKTSTLLIIGLGVIAALYYFKTKPATPAAAAASATPAAPPSQANQITADAAVGSTLLGDIGDIFA